MSQSPEQNPFRSAQPVKLEIILPPGYQDQQGDATGGVIPYKNPPALIGYYLGIVALFPIIGIPFGMASIVLGIMGLRKRKREPHVKGTAHAIIAIVLGTGSVVLYGTLILIMFAGLVFESGRF